MSTYASTVLADTPVGYWRLGETESYPQAVLRDNAVGYWRLGESESYAQAVLRDGAVGFWRLDEASGGTGADASGNGRAVTYVAPVGYGTQGVLATGTTGVTLPGGQAGNTGYVLIPGAANLAVGTGSLSFECWIQTTVAGPTSHFVADNKVGSSNGAGFNLYIATFGGLTFGLGNGSAYAETSTTGGNLVADGRWHHVVIVVERLYDAVHDRQRIYVDGVLNRSSDLAVAGWNLTSTNALYLGRYVNAGAPGGFDYAGMIDEVAWYLTALSPAQVANHYALRLSTLTATTPIVAADTTAAARNGAYAGGVTLAQPSPLSDGSTTTRFDGATASVSIPNAAALQIVGDFSLEVWVNLAAMAGRQTVVTKGPANEFELTVETNGSISFYNANESINSPAALVVGAWAHVVVTRVVATKTLAIYVNGAVVRTSTYTLVVTSGTSPVLFGRTQSATQYTNGSIDDVALYNYTLTPAQIATHYALRTSTATATTALLARDETAGAKHGTYSGGIAVGQRPGAVLTNTAALFDGITGVVKALGVTTIGGAAAATIEAWIHFNGVAQSAGQRIFANVGNGGHYLQMQSAVADVSFRITGVQTHVPAAVAVSLTGWHHVVGTWASGSVIRLYVDGVQVSTSGVLSGTLDAAPGVSIGAFDPTAPTAFFGGTIDEVAVYTSALTAPQVAAHYAARTLVDRPTALLEEDDDMPYNGAAIITPSDTIDLNKPADAIYVGGGGDVALVLSTGTTRTFAGVAPGSILPITTRRVNAALTTATSLLALYRS